MGMMLEISGYSLNWQVFLYFNADADELICITGLILVWPCIAILALWNSHKIHASWQVCYWNKVCLFHALIDVCIALKRFVARSVSLYFRFKVIRFVLGVVVVVVTRTDACFGLNRRSKHCLYLHLYLTLVNIACTYILRAHSACTS